MEQPYAASRLTISLQPQRVTLVLVQKHSKGMCIAVVDVALATATSRAHSLAQSCAHPHHHFAGGYRPCIRHVH